VRRLLLCIGSYQLWIVLLLVTFAVLSLADLYQIINVRPGEEQDDLERLGACSDDFFLGLTRKKKIISIGRRQGLFAHDTL
jgi:hypothetical protein